MPVSLVCLFVKNEHLNCFATTPVDFDRHTPLITCLNDCVNVWPKLFTAEPFSHNSILTSFNVGDPTFTPSLHFENFDLHLKCLFFGTLNQNIALHC